MKHFWYRLALRVRQMGTRGLMRAGLLLCACALGCSGAWAQEGDDEFFVVPPPPPPPPPPPTTNPYDAPLHDVIENMEGAPWSAVQMAAQQQAEQTFGPVHRNIPGGTPFFKVFEGTFFPASDLTRLAIFSDDGCNVLINGQLVWSRFLMGQHLPNLNQSLHPIPFALVAGRAYNIRVEYSNTHYFGTTDADGATLFAYTYDENPYRPYLGWLVGRPISCAGIRWPSPGAPIQAGKVGTFAAYGATDWDELQRMSGGVVTSRLLADSCTYSWTVTGGTFLASDDTPLGTSASGPQARWRAPSGGPSSVVVTLVVDDRNEANVGVGEIGTRNDPALGFSMTVNVN